MAAMTGIQPAGAATWRDEIRAIAFDVQGTCVDFYQPILRAGQAVDAAKGLTLDWAKL